MADYDVVGEVRTQKRRCAGLCSRVPFHPPSIVDSSLNKKKGSDERDAGEKTETAHRPAVQGNNHMSEILGAPIKPFPYLGRGFLLQQTLDVRCRPPFRQPCLGSMELTPARHHPQTQLLLTCPTDHQHRLLLVWLICGLSPFLSPSPCPFRDRDHAGTEELVSTRPFRHRC